MKPERVLKISICIILCLAILTPAAFGGVKERMKKRLPVIAQLKASGIIGETNRGYLGFVGAAREKADVIAAENKDRKAIYSYFAKQQGTTLDKVEQIQAKRKAKKAKSGEFIQQSNGGWVKK